MALGAGGPGTQSPLALLIRPYCPSALQLASGVNSGQGLGIEIIGTLQLVLCVLATTDRRRRDLGGSAPLAIGFSVALGHLLAVSGGFSPGGGRGGESRSRQGLSGWVSCTGQGKGPPTGLTPWGQESALCCWGTGPAQERGAQGAPDHLSGSACPSLPGSDRHPPLFLSVCCVSLFLSPGHPPLCLRRSTTLAVVLTLPGPSAPR